MDDLQPLHPGDPRNRLSRDARKRIERAEVEAEAITRQAEVSIENEGLGGISAHRKRREARLKAAQHALTALRREYSSIRLLDKEYRESINNEIEGIVNSLELNTAERQLLATQFFFPEEPELQAPPEWKEVGVFHSRASERPSAAQRYMDAMIDARHRAAAEIAYEKRLKELREAEQSKTTLPVPSATGHPEEAKSIVAERMALLEAYKRECKERGIKITDAMIAKAASPKWNERTPVQRWKRNDSRCTPGDDAKIRSVLRKKPHLQ